MSVEISKLANGLTVATDTMPGIGTAAVSVSFGAGSRSETDSEHGLAHLLEHMAFKGTSRRSAQRIVEEMEDVGGDLNAATSVEQTSYDARVLEKDVPLALDLLSDILTDPLLLDEELKREKGVIIQEIGAIEDAPDDLVYDLAHEIAFAGQSVGRPILGTPKSVKALDKAAITGFLGRHYRAGAGVVSVAGAADHKAIVRLAEDHLGGLASGEGPKAPQAVWTGGEKRVQKNLEQAHLVLTFPGRALGDEDTIALQIFSNLLGGGMSSRLFQEIREKRGLVYSIQSFHWAFSDCGLFGVYAGTGGEDVAELTPVMLDEIAGAARTANETEVLRAKAQLRMALELSREQPGSRAERLSRQILVLGRPVSSEEVLTRLEAVTVEDVRRVGLEAISAAPALAALGPVRGLPPLERINERLGSARVAA
ncbi:peptidase M16 [Terrihabitans soli]|uniref:Peptidase M16 n=1 Tax=Terrihabitans soli TaxID=708113 RepID=A0A6S6QX91_9HYPH|nr:pitrilysin family protein [Terrihabitans soli]BCJ91641.1 peptidase M16 [Terrihabitans soli]